MRLFERIAIFLGSWSLIGYIPWAPATFATLGAIPIVALLAPYTLLLKIIFTLFFGCFAVAVCSQAEKSFGLKDDRRIVLDEVAGFLIASLFTRYAFAPLFVTFVLFRMFDVFKFYPAYDLQKCKGGWGVVLDDIAAGVHTAFTMLIIRILFNF